MGDLKAVVTELLGQGAQALGEDAGPALEKFVGDAGEIGDGCAQAYDDAEQQVADSVKHVLPQEDAAGVDPGLSSGEGAAEAAGAGARPEPGLFSRTGARSNADVLANGGEVPQTQEAVASYAARSGMGAALLGVP